ncbi:RICIN domain-containing protein, partial [Micromonospora aurantiaca (nom. illeg.)]|uniref:RICIN domain-containing protein n=3 Tax=Micromonospora TaxID=1873 RepID=UPI003EBFCFAD
MSRRRFSGRRLVIASSAIAAALAVPAAIVALVGPAGAAVTPTNGGTYTLANGSSGKCVDVTGAGTDNGVRLIQVQCGSTTP